MAEIKKKNILWAFGILLVCILAGTQKTDVYGAAGAEVIVPAQVSVNATAAEANTYQFHGNDGALAALVQVSQAGAVTLEVTPQNADAYLTIVLSSSSNPKDSDAWLSLAYAEDGKAGKINAYADNASIWYLYVISIADTNQNTDITVKAYQRGLPLGNGSLKKDVWSPLYIASKKTVDYAIKVPSSGCVKFELSPESSDASPDLMLLNSKKKAVNKNAFLSEEGTVYFGMKKGTYYVRIKNSGLYGNTYKIRYTFEKIKTTKNTKPSKAVDLKKGRAAKGLFLNGDKIDTHWYKIKLTKNQTVKLNMPLKNNNNSLLVTVYRSDGKSIKELTMKNGKNQKKMKLKKGTYYLEIYSSSAAGYSVQWK